MFLVLAVLRAVFSPARACIVGARCLVDHGVARVGCEAGASVLLGLAVLQAVFSPTRACIVGVLCRVGQWVARVEGAAWACVLLV